MLTKTTLGFEGLSELDKLWGRFAAPESTPEFYDTWLAILCRTLFAVRAGLLLLKRADARYAPAAIWPTPQHDVKYLVGIAEKALTDRQAVIHVVAANDASEKPGVIIAFPFDVGGSLHGVVVLDSVEGPGTRTIEIVRALHWAAGWLEAQIWQNRAEQADEKLTRSAVALDLLALVAQQDRFGPAATALVNELSVKLGCERVSLGIVKARTVRLRAMSNAAWFSAKADIVSAIEIAMQEALDQVATVNFPPSDQNDPHMAVAHRQLAERFGAAHAMSVLLQSPSGPFGVLTLERQNAPFDAQHRAVAELAASLVGPSLAMMWRGERWISGRIAAATDTALRRLFGPRHLTLKIGALLAVAALGTLAVLQSDFRVSAKAVLEGAVQRAAVSPFEGYIQEAAVRAGDIVQQGQVMARLSDRDLKLDLLKWQSERDKVLQKQRDALAKHDRVGVLVAGAQLRQAEAQLRLAGEKLGRTAINAPISGIVVSGDLSQMLGAPVEQGKVLYEIAPLDAYRVVLQVDEYDIGYIKPGQQGTMLLSGATGDAIPLAVDKVSSVSTPQDGRNFFRVEASLQDSKVALRPGMEGVAKVVIDRRPALWIWTRTTIDRLRVLSWHWLP